MYSLRCLASLRLGVKIALLKWLASEEVNATTQSPKEEKPDGAAPYPRHFLAITRRAENPGLF
jgi:hypothetical protein